MLQEATRGIDPHLARLPGASGTPDAASPRHGTRGRRAAHRRGTNQPVPGQRKGGGQELPTPAWHPHQARHPPGTARGTKVLAAARRRSGLETLGHSCTLRPVHGASRPAAARPTPLRAHLNEPHGPHTTCWGLIVRHIFTVTNIKEIGTRATRVSCTPRPVPRCTRYIPHDTMRNPLYLKVLHGTRAYC